MSRKDTKSIKYVLNEMDPSERIEFERELKYDPDLLIEVESLKRMQRRLEHLPNFTPPKEISESLFSLASEELIKEGGNKRRYYLTAALLLFGLTTGSLLMENPFASEGSHSQASISINSSTVISEETNRISNNKNLTPWVDRNNVLNLSGFDSGNYNTRILDINDNHPKLRPADNSLYRNSVTRSLHLTGSNK